MVYLVISNLLLFGFIIYRDLAHRQDIERKDNMLADLELKYMSKDVDDYVRAKALEPEDMQDAVEDNHVPIEDISDEQFYGAKDHL